MTSNDNEDPITPGPEDRTMPSGKAQRKVPGKAKPATDGDGIDRTMPSGSVTPPVETGGLDLTMPSGGAKPPVDEGGFDLTAPSGKAHLDGAEDATMPSGSAGADKSEDATMASGNAGGASEDATMASGNAGGASEDPTMASGSAKASGQVYNAGELMGKTIGGCRIDKLLGRGAMGAVYKARQLKLDRDVAVKVIRPEMMTDPRMLKRFQIEARTVGKFNSANVVMVHDVGFELGVHYLVMEFVEGKNLREHVKLLAGGRRPAGEALSLIRQSCKGLEEARRLKVVHRDIKPDNLMLTTQNVLKIADFGIAK
ncbi:MAG: tRNA A-37 threonylcarbamoyl transferase component Bud32, partial [Planctomycetota bacterium]